MSWLFWVLLVLMLLCAVRGFQKGMIRTAFAMFSFVLVIGVTVWITPYVSTYIRTHTQWQQRIQEKCENVINQGLESQGENSLSTQISFIEGLSLPQVVKDELIENNNNEIYNQLAVESFGEYLSEYISNGVISGITFMIAFLVAVLIMQMILYAVDILTELPVIGWFNRLGGFLLGLIQGLIWIWILFLVITVLYNTVVGKYLIETIQSDGVLVYLFNNNYLVQVVMGIII